MKASASFLKTKTIMKEKSFIDKHPNITSVVSVIVWFLTLAFLSVMTGCKPQQHIVEIVKTDTLHVYHTDTLKVVHNDTIYSVKVETKHDSIIIKEKEKIYLDSDGNVLHSEKEKEKESWHNSDTNSSLIQHTVDSIMQAKMDSIYNASHTDKPVIVEVEKPITWYQKVWNWIVGKFAWVGLAFVAVLLGYILVKYVKKKV